MADRMRPQSLADCVGQSHLLGVDKPLRRAVEGRALHSMILWGPPGTGKTTLARLLASGSDLEFVGLSAVQVGIKDVRVAVERAQQVAREEGRGTLFFLDEVHRFNKAQQDAFLPYVEDGTLVFVGATTENPSFEINNALLSRARVYVLRRLEVADLAQLLGRALADAERGLGARQLRLSTELRDQLAEAADGDARRALNLLELASQLVEDGGEINESIVADIITGGVRQFDKGGDFFYDQISALHKSVRGSSPDGALYWLTRMLDGGCDPLYIARRVVRMASEDIGNADPRALNLALDAWDVLERLGSPEGELALAQAVVYLASTAKSNAVYTAFNKAMADAKNHGSLPVPPHLRNAPTRLMKQLGHGQNYRYAHDEHDGFAAGENYFPEGMKPVQYYHPVMRGLEARIAERLAELRLRDRQARQGVNTTGSKSND